MEVLKQSYDHPSFYAKLCPLLKHHVVDARCIHACLMKMAGLASSTFICNNLISAYAAQGMIGGARNLFDEMLLRNAYSWSAMILSYTQIGNLRDAVLLFKRMHDCRIGIGETDGEGCEDDGSVAPNKFVFGSILKGCAGARDLGTGMQFHCSATKFGFVYDTYMVSTLVDMYAECGDVERSWSVFKHNPDKDVVSWTTMITCFANHGKQHYRDASFGLFGDMIGDGVWPVDMTFTSLVKIFDEPRKLGQAKQVHGCMVKFGIELDELLGSALIAMYGRCEGLDEAIKLSVMLRSMDVVSWTSLLMAYIHNGSSIEAMNVFHGMLEKKIRIDPFVVSSILGACSSLGMLGAGKEIHGFAVRNSFLSNISVGNAIITLYGRCHEFRKAEMVFRQMKKRDEISWTALSTCYVQNNFEEGAISLFLEMIREGQDPSSYNFTSIIHACSTMGSLFIGEQMHSSVVRTGLGSDLSVTNSLITMYGKCGDIAAALQLFNSMTDRDVVSWNAMIAVFSQHGFDRETLNLFYDMQHEGKDPDDYTFLGLLVSCSYAGRIDEACYFFNLMRMVYGMEPKMEHYACMVDLYGRAGKLNDAIAFIDTMPYRPNHLVWEALLASCMFHGNTELGEITAEKILQNTANNPSAYTILSNIHASMGMWETKANVLTGMKSRGIRKEPSRSWLEIRGYTHEFSTNENSHPLIQSIYQKLEELKTKMEEAGYIPDTNYVLHDLEPDQKERALLHHSEKLAVAFALIAIAKEIPIRIMQNLRCCGDCHSAFKLISLIEDRHIVLRDRKRFHHFSNGACSCKDYW